MVWAGHYSLRDESSHKLRATLTLPFSVLACIPLEPCFERFFSLTATFTVCKTIPVTSM